MQVLDIPAQENCSVNAWAKHCLLAERAEPQSDWQLLLYIDSMCSSESIAYAHAQ